MPAGTILVVRNGMYGGVARVPPELKGVAQVLQWRQVQQHAAVTDFLLLRRVNLWGALPEGVRRTPPPPAFWGPLEPRCARVYNA